MASVKVDGQSGTDDLLLNSVVGVEKLGQPFRYTMEMLRNIGAKIDISKLLGKKVTISLKGTLKKTPERNFYGYIAEIRNSGMSSFGLESYHALVVPWLWFLRKSSNCRIFRDKAVKDIIAAVFKSNPNSFEDFDVEDLPKEPKIEHCVQYHETDYAFVHRLMEEHGISYYFTHKDNKHTMVLLDSAGNRPDTPPDCGFKEMKYIKGDSDADNTISYWERRQQVVTDAFEQADFHFASKDKFPTLISGKAEEDLKQGDFAAKSLRRRAYEATFDEGISDPHELKKVDLDGKEKGDKLTATKIAEVRLGSFKAEKEIIYAESDCRGLHAGYEFKLSDFTSDTTQNGGEYYVTSVNHNISVGGYGRRRSQAGKRYTCSITAIPKETEYYPPQVTPKARIYGPQTATVVSEKSTDDQLIYTDKHGRVKIQFHWDSVDDRGKVDSAMKSGGSEDKVDKDTKNRSCWVRVAQGWAGNKWGSFFLPRVGQEVIVEFLDGDPDRPIITGSVYNGKNLTPYKLTDHDTISTIKSESVGSDGKKAKKITFNEIRFEDKEEKEHIFIHAGRSMDSRVLGDRREYVGCNMQLTIDGTNTEYEEKTDDDSNKLGRDVVVKGGNDQLTLEEGNLIQQLQKGSHLLEIASHGNINIGGTLSIKVKGKLLISAEDAIHIKSDKSIVAEAKEAISFKAGKNITLDAKAAINLNSKDEVLCKGASGIGLTGDKSTIDISSDVGIKGGSNVVIKGTKVDINGGTPKSPTSPATAESAEDAKPQTAEDLEKAKINLAAFEDAYVDAKAIKFGELE